MSLHSIIVFAWCLSLPTCAAVSTADFISWAQRHGKEYGNHAERAYRHSIWRANAKNVVIPHNDAYRNGFTSYTMSVMDSPFSDWTDQEFADTYLMEPRHCALNDTKLESQLSLRNAMTHYHHQSLRSGKQKVDWREHGIMTPVKSQGHCGSCWTFATTGTLEAHMCLAQRKDCSTWSGLSEQQLVDCSGGFANEGCNGGWPSAALEYIKYNGGIATEEAYPYQAETQSCSILSNETSGANVIEVFNITFQDESDLESVIMNIGPVSLAYQVAPDFRFYAHGVYDSYNATTNETTCHSEEKWLNHAVVAIGLDETETGVPFYIIRNSWGTSWGMEGHFWMKRGVNLCGVSDCASFPIVPSWSVAAS